MSEYELYHSGARKHHKYIKKIGDRYFYTQQEIAAYLKEKKRDVTLEKSKDDDGTREYRLDFNKEKGSYTDSKGKKHTYTMSDGIGLEVGNKKIAVYNTTNKTYEKNPDVKGDTRGRFRREYAEDGSRYSLDYSDRKTYRQRQRKEVEQRKNNAEWLKSMGVDTREHEADYRSRKAELDRAEKKDAAREARKKKAKKAAKKTLKSLKKQASRGKKALDKWYTKATTPDITVTYDEAKIKKK